MQSEKSNVKTLLQRIIEVKKKVTEVVKDGTIDAGNNSYDVVTHDAVTKTLHMPLADAGIIAWPTQVSCELVSFDKPDAYDKTKIKTVYRVTVRASIRFINADDANDFRDSEATAYAFDSGDKASGKAYSMAIKMIHMKVFLLESKDKEEERSTEALTQYNAVTGPIEPKKAKSTNYADQIGKPAKDPFEKESEFSPTRPIPNENAAGQEKYIKDGISANQLKRLYAISKEKNWSSHDIDAELKRLKLKDLRQIYWKEYNDLIKIIESNPFFPNKEANVQEQAGEFGPEPDFDKEDKIPF